MLSSIVSFPIVKVREDGIKDNLVLKPQRLMLALQEGSMWRARESDAECERHLFHRHKASGDPCMIP